jgi:hypothetical protein
MSDKWGIITEWLKNIAISRTFVYMHSSKLNCAIEDYFDVGSASPRRAYDCGKRKIMEYSLLLRLKGKAAMRGFLNFRFKVQGSRFKVQGSRFKVPGQGSRFKFRFKVQVQGSRFRFKVQGSSSRFKVQSFNVIFSFTFYLLPSKLLLYHQPSTVTITIFPNNEQPSIAHQKINLN